MTQVNIIVLCMYFLCHAVVELPPPPMDLNVSTLNFTFLSITWKQLLEKESYYYVVHIIDESTSDRIKQINTTKTQVQYNLSELKVEYSIDWYSLPSIVFSVSAVHSWLVDDIVGCASKESEAKEIPDVSFIVQDCVDTGIVKNLVWLCVYAILLIII